MNYQLHHGDCLDVMPTLRKTCNKCKQSKSVNEFHKNPKTKDGYYTDCKECCAIYQREYRKQNREKLGQDKKLYAEQNRDVVLAKKRAYAAANRENESARAIQWQKDNPDKVIVRSKLRRFRQRANGGEVTETQWQQLKEMFDNKCARCGKKCRLEMDHIVPVKQGGKGDVTNLQPLCRSCNASKMTNAVDYRSESVKEWARSEVSR